MKKKIFSTALSAVLALSLCPAIALADTGDTEANVTKAGTEASIASEETTAVAPTDIQVFADASINTLATTVASGELGTCTWTIDSNGCLTIAPTNGVSGTFEMENPQYNSWPWFDNRRNIYSANVKPGVSASGSLDGMFNNCSSLKSLDIASFDTSNVTNMGIMFNSCQSLTTLDLTSFDTSNVTDMNCMFMGCSSLTSLDISTFDTSQVTDMSSMFESCYSLETLNLSGLDLSSVSTMLKMFRGCSSLTSINLLGWNTSNVTNMGDMFRGCSSLTNLDLSFFDMSSIDGMAWMFRDCSSLASLNLSGWDTSNIWNMYGLFDGCASLTALDLSSFDTSHVTSMSTMFSGCSSLAFLDLSGFDTSSVKDMDSLFLDCTGLRTVVVSADFAFSSDTGYLPVPTQNGVEGKWRSSVDGTIYDDPSQLPSNVAATYTAVFPTDKGGFGPIFSDVFTKTPANNWYYDAIYFMVSIGIITGYDEGTFGVGQSMTRADLIVIIWRYCEPDAYEHYDQSTATNTSGLPDVPDKEYYTGAVNWAVANGVITGYDLGNGSYIFAPDDAVTFDQIVTIIARYAIGFNAAENYNDSVLHNSKFTDGAAVEDWAHGSMAWAINNGVVTGNNNGNGTYTIAPLDSVARERGATVFSRSIQSGLVIAA